jgi:hypothetical protein
MDANDGRNVAVWLPELVFDDSVNPVVQVVEEKIGTVRAQGSRFQPRLCNKPDGPALAGLEAKEQAAAGQKSIQF